MVQRREEPHSISRHHIGDFSFSFWIFPFQCSVPNLLCHVLGRAAQNMLYCFKKQWAVIHELGFPLIFAGQVSWLISALSMRLIIATWNFPLRSPPFLWRHENDNWLHPKTLKVIFHFLLLSQTKARMGSPVPTSSIIYLSWQTEIFKISFKS